jgi:hypothetical protein
LPAPPEISTVSPPVSASRSPFGMVTKQPPAQNCDGLAGAQGDLLLAAALGHR